MPTIALISDIHANAHALRAVLAEIDACCIDEVVCCGDIIGYGPHAVECVRLVRETCTRAVLGNHEWFALAGRRHRGVLPSGPEAEANPVWAGIHHALRTLDDEALDWLEKLPLAVDLPGALASHAALHDVRDWPYLHSPKSARPTLEVLAGFAEQLGFFGHTHRQEWFALPKRAQPQSLSDDIWHLPADCVCAVIVGSVGQPRLQDTRAAWTIWDSDKRTIEFRRTDYPVYEAAADFLAAGLPRASARRLLP